MTAIFQSRVRLGLAFIVLLGAFFRLYHADWKLYSFDETATSMRVSGHTFAEYKEFVHDGRTHRLADVRKFQAVDPARGASAVWKSLALEDPQHPPLYFLTTRYVEALIGGDSVFLRRLPAIVFGLLALFAAWFLANELFDDQLTAWAFAALVAVSPFHVEYAQQDREYSMWTLLICVSSTMVLRFLRTGRPLWWILYAATVSIGLWSYTLMALIALAHGIYALLPRSTEGDWRRRIAVLGAIIAAAITFVPWIAVLASRSGVAVADTTWSAQPLSAPLFVGKWLFNASTVFFDLDYLSLALLPVAIILLGIAARCCWLLVRRAPVGVWSFIALLAGLDLAAFLGPDLVLHETYSVQSRYLTPLWLGVELATAFGIAFGLRLPRVRERSAYAGALIAVLTAGVAACCVGSVAHSWWLANNEKTIPAIAAALSQQTRPTIIFVDDDDELLELAASGNLTILFHLHPSLSLDVLDSCPYPIVVSRSAAIRPAAALRRLQMVVLPKLFPYRDDPIIGMLRHRAASDRSDAVSGDLALFQSRSMPAIGLPVRTSTSQIVNNRQIR